jgi:hypothetical protein
MKNRHDINRFSEVTDLLANTEIPDNGSKEKIFNRLTFKMNSGTIQADYTQKDVISMKAKKWKSIAVAAAAIVCFCGALSTTSYAQDMLQSILARFQVGNLEITQYDKELPAAENSRAQVKEQPAPSERAPRTAPQPMTLDEARRATGMDFPAPAWLAENYKYVNSVAQGKQAVEVQYEKEGEFISLLISKGGENGIQTTDEVRTVTIGGIPVYFANGIVIWAYEGFTYELYQMAETNFSADAVGQIIASLAPKK